MASSWTLEQVPKAALVVLFILLIGGGLIYAFLLPWVKELFKIEEDDKIEINEVKKSFDEFINNIEKCSNTKGDCKCTNEIRRFPKSYNFVIEKGGKRAYLVKKNNEIIAERTLSYGGNCLVNYKNKLLYGSFVDSDFNFSFDKPDKVILSYNLNNKEIKEEALSIFKFYNGDLCIVTNKIYSKSFFWFGGNKKEVDILLNANVCKIT